MIFQYCSFSPKLPCPRSQTARPGLVISFAFLAGLVLAILVIMALGQAQVGLSAPAQAQETSAQNSSRNNALRSSLDANIDLTRDGEARVTLTVTLRNLTSDQVITNYELPDVWDLRSPSFNTGNRTTTSLLSGGKLTFDFSSQPLLPGDTTTIRISANSRGLESYQGLKIYSQDTINARPVREEIASWQTKIIYPQEWGEPTTNLDPTEVGTERDAGSESNQTELKLKNIFQPLELVWYQSMNYEVEYEVSRSPQLVLLPRRAGNQSFDFGSPAGVSRIFRDDSGNNFMLVEASAEDLPSNYSFSVSTSNEGMLESPELSAYPRVAFPLPAGLKAAITAENTDIDTEMAVDMNAERLDKTISNIISEIVASYEISPYQSDPEQRQYISESGIADSDQINYIEYLLLINQALHLLDIKNEVVLVDNRAVRGSVDFVIEVCGADRCHFFDPAPRLQARHSRNIPVYGVQLLAFDGINHIVIEQLNQGADILPSISANSNPEGIAGLADDNGFGISGIQSPQITLSIPDAIKNFSNFPAVITIDNATSSPIFVEEIRIDGKDFPIVDIALSGLYEGVLPGESKTFQVDNVFLALLFPAVEEQSDIEIGLVYQDDIGYQLYETSQIVTVRQNQFFLILVVMTMVTVSLAIYALFEIYRLNRYAFLSGYWQARRNLNSLVWRLNFINRWKRLA